ncbi:MAG TPA: Flp family type IVb pilin [Pseudomonas sp.]|nr:Flp family type IVb pilin [Pseudomonas sp.]
MNIKNFRKAVVVFFRDEEGLTMVEYAVAGALVTLGAVAAFTTLGTNIGTSITKLASCVVGDTSVCK